MRLAEVAIQWGKLVNELVGGTIFALIGILLLVVGFLILDKLTPGNLWKELMEEHNTALAIFLGAMGMGISIIIAAALVS